LSAHRFHFIVKSLALGVQGLMLRFERLSHLFTIWSRGRLRIFALRTKLFMGRFKVFMLLPELLHFLAEFLAIKILIVPSTIIGGGWHGLRRGRRRCDPLR
jgi:hypothetical protein